MTMRSTAVTLVLLAAALHGTAQALPAVQRQADATAVATTPTAAGWLARFDAWRAR
jgi:hypothetical protein